MILHCMPLLQLFYEGDKSEKKTKGERMITCDPLIRAQVLSVVGILQDETDPMVSVMKVR